MSTARGPLTHRPFRELAERTPLREVAPDGPRRVTEDGAAPASEPVATSPLRPWQDTLRDLALREHPEATAAVLAQPDARFASKSAQPSTADVMADMARGLAPPAA